MPRPAPQSSKQDLRAHLTPSGSDSDWVVAQFELTQIAELLD
jgi:hypothetical protein